MGRGACLVGEPVTSQSGPSQPPSHLPRFWPPPPPPRTPDFRVDGFWGGLSPGPEPWDEVRCRRTPGPVGTAGRCRGQSGGIWGAPGVGPRQGEGACSGPRLRALISDGVRVRGAIGPKGSGALGLGVGTGPLASALGVPAPRGRLAPPPPRWARPVGRVPPLGPGPSSAEPGVSSPTPARAAKFAGPGPRVQAGAGPSGTPRTVPAHSPAPAPILAPIAAPIPTRSCCAAAGGRGASPRSHPHPRTAAPGGPGCARSRNWVSAGGLRGFGIRDPPVRDRQGDQGEQTLGGGDSVVGGLRGQKWSLSGLE